MDPESLPNPDEICLGCLEPKSRCDCVPPPTTVIFESPQDNGPPLGISEQGIHNMGLEYAEWEPGDEEIALDGRFSIEDLEAIINRMKAK